MKRVTKYIDFHRIINSFRLMKHSKNRLIVFGFYLLAVQVCFIITVVLIRKIQSEKLEQFLLWLICTLEVVVSVIGCLRVLTALGKPFGTNSIENKLRSISFSDISGEAPKLLSYVCKERIITITFYSPLIPLSVFIKRQDEIENCLNLNMISINTGKDLQEIEIKAIKGDTKLPDFIPWCNSYISDEDAKIVLGKTLLEKYKIDFSKTPHYIVAGATGSGKSVLIKLIIYQLIRKKADVYLVDYKQGVDYPNQWQEYCRLIYTDADFIRVLEDVIEVMDDRMRILKESGYNNIEQYNKHHEFKLKRIIVVVDELAEALSKNGADKERKNTIAQIEKSLETISRLGRFGGIHLLLGLQRPDSTILSGQIKSNVRGRLLGRADKILADIVLDNRDYADKIPSDAQGLFVDGNGTVFRSYYIDDNVW